MSTESNNAAVVDSEIIDREIPDAPAHNPTELGDLSIASEGDELSSNNSHVVKKIYLKDYRPPAYSVDNVDLDIKLYDDHAIVDSVLTLQRWQKHDRHNISENDSRSESNIDSNDEYDLILSGQNLELLSVSIDGEALSSDGYVVDDEQLRIKNAPDKLTLAISVRHVPQKNTELEGLYIAGQDEDTMFVTQCEPEGFRKITYYLDRPDVLATFRTRLEASKRFPTLLANGDLMETGEVEGDSSRHYAIWEDPTKKPSYLFACVFADLAVLSDRYTTIEGRDVLLELYAEPKDIDKCHLAMQALKDSMAWDEENYGRAYDLDRYMIVATSQFNMGAMENKGLNIFNTACVLSSPETTTDMRSFSVKAIIAHEYFHNWTGNRITCRDWFQLCLKEGFTVFRDQSFSADQQSAAVQRIDDVALLRAHQFSEDAGPLAHPPRPNSFVEINNFYTTTVYEKGAEIMRMMANYLGDDEFRRGTDEYFTRYDGQAVTVEDLLSALSVGETSVEPFLDWYTQPGTPEVSGKAHFDVSADTNTNNNTNTNTLTLSLRQRTRHVPGFDAPKPLPIPVATAIFDPNTGDIIAERMLMLDDWMQDFTFTDLPLDNALEDGQEPIVSLLRDFSAPVQLKYDYSSEDLAFLVQYETNGFNQWQYAQMLVNKVLLSEQIEQTASNGDNDVVYNTDKDKQDYMQAIKQGVLTHKDTDPMLAARLMDIPSERELATAFHKDYLPEAVKTKRDAIKKALASYLKDEWAPLYEQLPITVYEDTPQARGRRALRNVVLDMALSAGIDEAQQWATEQYDNASCMTERLGALYAIVTYEVAERDAYLADFYQRFEDEALVIDLWFSVQASNPQATVTQISELMAHPDFRWDTPNRIRAVVSSFAAQPTLLWSEQGLDVYIGIVETLDDSNPVLAARLLQALSRWFTLEPAKRDMAKAKLEALQDNVSSKNVLESLQQILSAD